MFGEFASWISEPEAYNWITLLGAVATVMTALFTGYAAWAAYLDRRERIRVEWEVQVVSGRPGFMCYCHIQNNTGHTLMGDRFSYRGPWGEVTSWTDGRRNTKHISWPSHAASVPSQISPNTNATLMFQIIPDPERLRAALKSPFVRLRYWLARALWSVSSIRYSSGAKFRVRLMVRRRSSPSLPIRFTHTIRIYPQIAMNIAETIEKKAAQK